MSFKDIEIKMDYDSDEDNLVSDFYLPVLSEATTYYRRSGFYSSSSLAVSARGIGELIRKNGKMKLICNVHLSENDYDALKRAQENPTKFLEESNIGFDLNNIEDEIEKDHVEALGWMLANGYLEIKIAFPQNNYGIYHPKTGVFFDEEGNYFSFSGSENESFTSMIFNVEEFKTFKSWEEWGHESALKDLKKFKKEWAGDRKSTIVVDLPTAIKDKLIKCVPHEKANLGLLKKNYPAIYKNIKNPLPARDYQTEAVNEWVNNGCIGIFNMATGSGKTITALNCYDYIKNNFKNNVLTVIACPQQHLVFQWREEIEKYFDIKTVSTVGNANWFDDITSLFYDAHFGHAQFPIILTTHSLYSSENFLKLFDFKNKKQFDFDMCLIVDEVHGVGSTEHQKGLIDEYTSRLGLSATPEKWFDDDGTKIIYDFFDKCVYKFSIEEALEKGYLTPYYYYPHFVDLTYDEYEKYLKLTKKIAILYDKNKNIEDLSLTKAYNERQAIIDNAISKFDMLEEILDKSSIKDHILIYCTSKHIFGKNKQIEDVGILLNNKNISNHKFTGNETKDLKIKLIDEFTDSDFNVLTAMKCLDEGVDIPSAKMAILMASTSNPREHIQRRGRILRRAKNKEFAVIHDLIVLPSLDDISNAEETFVLKELRRYKEFARLAKNHIECNEILMNWLGI